MNILMIPILLGIIAVILTICLFTINFWKIVHIDLNNAKKKKDLIYSIEIFKEIPPWEYILLLLSSAFILLFCHFVCLKQAIILSFAICAFLFSLALILIKVIHNYLFNLLLGKIKDNTNVQS